MPEIQSRENTGLKQSKQKKVFLKLRQHCKPPTMAVGCFWELEDPQSSTQLRNSGEPGSLQKLPTNRSFCQQELETLLAHFLGFPLIFSDAYLALVGEENAKDVETHTDSKYVLGKLYASLTFTFLF